MILSISHGQRTLFTEGASAKSCSQVLRNLITSIQNAIRRVFECLLPCLFKKGAEPTKIKEAKVIQSDPAKKIAAVQKLQKANVEKKGKPHAPAQPKAAPLALKPVKEVVEPQAELLVHHEAQPAEHEDLVHVEPQGVPQGHDDEVLVAPAAQPAENEDLVHVEPQGGLPPRPMEKLNGGQSDVGSIDDDSDLIKILMQKAKATSAAEEADERARKKLEIAQKEREARMASLKLTQSARDEALLDETLERLDAQEPREESKVSNHGGMTDFVRSMLKMPTAERNEILNQIDPPKWPGAIRADAPFKEEQARSAIFMVLQGIEDLWDQKETYGAITAENLQKIQSESVVAFEEHAGEQVLFSDVIQSWDGLEEVQPGPKLERNIHSIALSLAAQARDKQLLAAVLISSDQSRTYGVFVQFNNRTGSCDFYLLDPYGDEGLGPLSLDQFTKDGLAEKLENANFRCTPLIKVDPEPDLTF